MENFQIIAIVVGGALAFALFWSVVVWLIAQLSGWSKLGEIYPRPHPFQRNLLVTAKRPIALGEL